MGSSLVLKELSKGIVLTEEPIGQYAPTSLQSAIIKFARTFGAENGAVRNYGAIAVTKLRPTPIDYDYHGLTLRFYPAMYASGRHMLFTPNWSEHRERDFILSHMPEDGVYVDAGTNAGFFLFYVAGHRPKSRILGFEPIAEYASILNFNIRSNGLQSAAVENIALSDHTGVVQMSRGSESVMYGNQDDVMTVPTARLDEALDRHAFDRVDVLKIDVEGFEDRVLMPFFREADPSIWPKAVLLEDCCREYWLEDCLAFMKSNGYTETLRSNLNVGLVRVS